jgi:hypothetical protein
MCSHAAPCDNAATTHSEDAVQASRLEIIRQTKLDLAQWIVAGIGQCRNPATALSLARYAAAQLEAAARIPAPRDLSRNAPESLLRQALRTNSSIRADSTAVLNRVSRAMLRMLVANKEGENAALSATCVQLARHELRAARMLMAVRPGKLAA